MGGGYVKNLNDPLHLLGTHSRQSNIFQALFDDEIENESIHFSAMDQDWSKFRKEDENVYHAIFFLPKAQTHWIVD